MITNYLIRKIFILIACISLFLTPFRNFPEKNKTIPENAKIIRRLDSREDRTVKTAKKIPVYELPTVSITDFNNGGISEYIIIYKKIWNADTEHYDNYAVDGNGNLIKVWESGDVIQWYENSEIPLCWQAIKHNDIYYDFYNPATNKYLSPVSENCISDTRIGVTLGGIAENTYSSAVEAWNNNTWNWYGLTYIGNDTNANGEYIISDNEIPELSAEENCSEKFIFAVLGDIPPFAPVETVDNNSKGIDIKIFNYEKNSQAGIIGNDQWTGDGGGRTENLVGNILGNDGFPIAVKNNNKSLAPLFNNSDLVTEYYTVNGLFLKSTYEETGYFEYSCFENSAVIERNNIPNGGETNFSVYHELVTPRKSDRFSCCRGNFLPFNHAGNKFSHNLYNSDGSLKSDDDPRKNEKLYISESADYYFGMSIETDFMIPKNGCDTNGNPVIFEFNGDDDFWLFIDNVLVMDIGGIHNALNGSINFSSGEIKIFDGTNKNTYTVTNIYEQFRTAGIFPDGTQWDDSKTDIYFSNGIFKDYSTHNMKIFYMERGAGASNLKLKFNLSTVENDSIFLSKDCTGDFDRKYPFQLYYKNSYGDFVLYNNTENSAPVYENSSDEIPYEETFETYNSVYFIKSGETAEFKLPNPNTEYYFREINLNTEEYNQTEINGEIFYGREDNIYKNITFNDKYIDISSDTDTPTNRKKVIFTNHISPEYPKDLKITKKVVFKNQNGEYENIQQDNSKFEFQVEFMDENGNFIPYNKGEYYLTDSENNYYKYSNGILTKSDSPTICSISGANGSIAGVPNGFTVIIKNILPDTVFKVYEQENKMPDGYKTLEYICGQENNEDSYFYTDSPNIGTVTENHNPNIIVVNEKYLTSEEKYGNIKIIKNINKSNPETGANIFMFGITNLENNNKYTVCLNLENKLTSSEYVKNIPVGRYKIEELSVLGYETVSVDSDSISPDFSGKTIAYITVSENKTVTVTYENNLTDKEIYKSFADNYINYNNEAET